ncbi:MAG: YdcF family protein [Thiohalocapsa sp.]
MAGAPAVTPVRRLLRLARRAGLLLLGVLAIWSAALACFVAASLFLPADPVAMTDAIVVPTGGRLRLETGVQLLADGKAKKLFISGVNRHVDRDELLRALGPAAEGEACCIELGHEADNTVGNAVETERWMRREGYRSLRLVTSWYHIERGLLEFRRAMPDIVIVAHPVFAPHVDPERWWGRHGALLLIVSEFQKYLLAWGRSTLEAALPARDAGPAAARSGSAISARESGPGSDPGPGRGR